MLKALEAADSSGVFRYQTGKGNWEPSTLYLWKDMIAGTKVMGSTGIGKQKLYIGEGQSWKYGLVNLAAFLGQAMKETVMYNACDENNWTDPKAAGEFGGEPYSASYSCGQGGQSYQVSGLQAHKLLRICTNADLHKC
jgi:hypothetical protein